MWNEEAWPSASVEMTKQTDKCAGGVAVAGRRGMPGGRHVDVLTLGELEVDASELCSFLHIRL